ncbi:hypothetical protein [Paracoccus methylarcula]|uniref:Uncharacterized protein n=1 Tax=Paracoccus methylarcula TaxID=72022 RepID=A0A422R1D9_9RHOB|nr:hypothetical protein [Paracoccus methylarcula]RNF36068.1 hypothetical protein A7A09_001285 [Paracoccus methylarcula]
MAKREVFEIALDIEDDDFLALIVDPVFGNPVFPEFADAYQLDTHRYLRDLHTGGNAARWPNHGEIEVKRRERVEWWSTDDRGFIIHDLTIPHVGIEQILRGLPRDQAALRCFAQGDRIPDDRQCAK